MASFLSKFIRSGAAAAGDLYADKAMAQMRDELMAKREAVLEENRRASQLEQREYQEGQQAEDREFRKGETTENRAYQEGKDASNRGYQEGKDASNRAYQEGKDKEDRAYRDSRPASPQDQLAQLRLEQAKEGGSDKLDPKEVRSETNRLLDEQKENGIVVGDDDYKDPTAMSEIAKQQLITYRAAPKGAVVTPKGAVVTPEPIDKNVTARLSARETIDILLKDNPQQSREQNLENIINKSPSKDVAKLAEEMLIGSSKVNNDTRLEDQSAPNMPNNAVALASEVKSPIYDQTSQDIESIIGPTTRQKEEREKASNAATMNQKEIAEKKKLDKEISEMSPRDRLIYNEAMANRPPKDDGETPVLDAIKSIGETLGNVGPSVMGLVRNISDYVGKQPSMAKNRAMSNAFGGLRDKIKSQLLQPEHILKTSESPSEILKAQARIEELKKELEDKLGVLKSRFGV